MKFHVLTPSYTPTGERLNDGREVCVVTMVRVGMIEGKTYEACMAEAKKGGIKAPILSDGRIKWEGA